MMAHGWTKARQEKRSQEMLGGRSHLTRNYYVFNSEEVFTVTDPVGFSSRHGLNPSVLNRAANEVSDGRKSRFVKVDGKDFSVVYTDSSKLDGVDDVRTIFEPRRKAGRPKGKS
jgi:hypothetical protein